MKWLLIILLFIFPPVSGRSSSSAESDCISNLKQIDGVVQQWAIENHKSDTNRYSLHDEEILRYFREGRLPVCRSGGVYVAGKTVYDVPRCTWHGTVESVYLYYQQLKRQEQRLQIESGLAAALVGLLVLLLFRRAYREGKMSLARMQVLIPAVMFVLGTAVSPLCYSLVFQSNFSVRGNYLPMGILASFGILVSIFEMRCRPQASMFYVRLAGLVNLMLLLIPFICGWYFYPR